MESNTGVTIRLSEHDIEHLNTQNWRPVEYVWINGERYLKYVAEEATLPGEGDVWIVRQNIPARQPSQNAPGTAVLAPNERYIQTGIPIPIERSQSLTDERSEYISTAPFNPLTNRLMPVILVCILLLSIVTIGGYTTLASVPLWLVIPIVLIGLLAYSGYRVSSLYTRMGDELQQFFTSIHTTDRKLDKNKLLDMLTGKHNRGGR